ncbi:hypothetical protein CPB85DRAFT_1303420 [Mucidula mucida]|nr:hypothetical protein CPB85DRAFT_1303420 [Mucidula mucida]
MSSVVFSSIIHLLEGIPTSRALIQTLMMALSLSTFVGALPVSSKERTIFIVHVNGGQTSMAYTKSTLIRRTLTSKCLDPTCGLPMNRFV